MKLLEFVTRQRTIEEENHADVMAFIAKLEALAEKYPELSAERFSLCGEELDIDDPPREEVVGVMETLKAGTWEKEYSGEYLSYRATVDGVRIRLWNAALPPSCRLVEVEVEVPAHVETRHKIVCNE